MAQWSKMPEYWSSARKSGAMIDSYPNYSQHIGGGGNL